MVDSQISSNFRKIPCWIIFRMFHGSIDFRTLIFRIFHGLTLLFCPSIFGGEGGSFHAPLSRALYLEAAAGEIQGAAVRFTCGATTFLSRQQDDMMGKFMEV